MASLCRLAHAVPQPCLIAYMETVYNIKDLDMFLVMGSDALYQMLKKRVRGCCREPRRRESLNSKASIHCKRVQRFKPHAMTAAAVSYSPIIINVVRQPKDCPAYVPDDESGVKTKR